MAEPIGKVFKYYIHDGIGECRLQFVGDFTEADIREISGCWETARTVLGTRTLILDLRLLATADDAGRIWLASLTAEGAVVIPEKAKKLRRKSAVFGKLGCLLRAFRMAEAESSTPVR